MESTARMDGSPGRVVSRETIHQTRKFSYESVTVERGSATYEVAGIKHPGAVVLLPIMDTQDGRVVVMIRNYRPLLGEHGKVIWELPAGTIERGEPVEVTAHRELVEETGYSAQHLAPICRFYTTPGMTDEIMWAYAAHGLVHVGARPEPDEWMTIELVPVGRVLAMIESGDLADGKSIVCLLAAARRGML
ncbi:MAG: NUDIX hydrolase [Phycisphaeraceae bacterium]|nr:NUDIX hydrolase [Phycisphaeraceae bacterium]MBX3367114.1 NUDIX hydrolase [Phycisphaeraceae bacterium]